MNDILAAVDETGANILLQAAQSSLGTLSDSTSGSLGPIGATASASASFSGGTVDLIAPDIVRIADCELHFSLNLTLTLDISDIIPDFCLPQVCIPTPFGKVCTPKICINWPTVSIPVSYSDMVKFTADFRLNVFLNASSEWQVDVVIVGVPSLQLSLAAAAILTAIGLAAAAVLAPIPFIGPVLAIAVAGILAVIGIAGVLGLLGPLLTPFVAGLAFTIYRQPQNFEVLPASGPLDPAVFVRLDLIEAAVESTDEDELVLRADISP